jgi:hypothetical protein
MDCHTFVSTHRDYVALEIAKGRVPHALIDDKLAEAMIAGVLICLQVVVSEFYVLLASQREYGLRKLTLLTTQAGESEIPR